LDDALGYPKRKNKLVIDNFKSYITLIENQWYWRIDDQYGIHWIWLGKIKILPPP
jgi:hypothetical protein